MLTPDEIEVERQLSGKSGLVVAAFSGACAKRLLNTASKVDNYQVLKSLAEAAFVELERYLVYQCSVSNDLAVALEQAIPDEDEDPTPAGALIDDALSSLYYALVSIEGSIENACNASTRALDAAFRIASSNVNNGILSKETEDEILGSSIVQRELTRQKRDIDYLAHSEFSQELVTILLNRVAPETIS
jgi:hypothetical protein